MVHKKLQGGGSDGDDGDGAGFLGVGSIELKKYVSFDREKYRRISGSVNDKINAALTFKPLRLFQVLVIGTVLSIWQGFISVVQGVVGGLIGVIDGAAAFVRRLLTEAFGSRLPIDAAWEAAAAWVAQAGPLGYVAALGIALSVAYVIAIGVEQLRG